MKKRQSSHVVKESHSYDDLLSSSPKTKTLINELRSGALKDEIKTNISKRSGLTQKTIKDVKVKLSNQTIADTFAKLIKQDISAKTKRIVFEGKYDELKGKAVIVNPLKKRGPYSFTDLTDAEKAKNQEKKLKNRRKIQNKVRWNTDDFYERHWIDMPPFENEEKLPFAEFIVSFPNVDSHKAWLKLTGETGSSFWFSEAEENETRDVEKQIWIGRKPTNRPQYPVYIISKGRAKYGPLTAKVLQRLGIPFYLMVEPHEYNKYRTLCDWAKDVLVIGDSNHGMGPGRARNACWDHAKHVLKSKRHWVLDDNIADFYRLHQNKRIRVGDGTIFRAAENFVDRYENVAVAGFAYTFFHVATSKQYPFKLNTRIYSCLLIDNDCPYRWRGRYNEDTILSLDVLKDVNKNKTHGDLNEKNKDGTYKNSRRDRLTTVEFVSFLQAKLNTQVQKGGNTAAFYGKEGTAPKSMMLAETHPDVATNKEMFSRAHHKANYEVFRNNWLIRTEKRKATLKSTEWKGFGRTNPYGMKLSNSLQLKD